MPNSPDTTASVLPVSCAVPNTDYYLDITVDKILSSVNWELQSRLPPSDVASGRPNGDYFTNYPVLSPQA